MGIAALREDLNMADLNAWNDDFKLSSKMET